VSVVGKASLQQNCDKSYYRLNSGATANVTCEKNVGPAQRAAHFGTPVGDGEGQHVFHSSAAEGQVHKIFLVEI
jgi:hypothetical protein